MEEALTALRDVDAGEVTMAASTTAGVYLLPPVVALFRERYPQVTLHIAILNSHEIVEETLNWNLDFGLVEGYASALPPALQVEVFAHDELVLVVSPWHRWNGLPALLPEDLGEGQLLMREQGSGIREVIEQVLLLHNVQVRPLLTMPDNEAIKQMAINGVGAAIVSALAVRRELAAGDLVRIPIAGVDLRPELSIVKRLDKQLSRAAQAFCAFLSPKEEDKRNIYHSA
jgi:DNA-binding transcriptional LysR family regulator